MSRRAADGDPVRVGGQTEVGRLRRVLLKHAREVLADAATVRREATQLGWEAAPDVGAALAEYEALAAILASFDVELDWLPRHDDTTLDSIYVHDPLIVADGGVVLCRMGKAARRAEPAAAAETFEGLGVPVLGSIDPPGTVEGGDVVWLDRRTLLVGRGYRTNDDGIRQLRGILGDRLDELVVVPLPHWRGPDDVLHLMSVLSPVDEATLLVYSPLLPVGFREWLMERPIRLVEVPEEEFASLGCNVLTVAPGRCVMLSGNPRTRARLEGAGCDIEEFSGDHICRRGDGGPTCLTRPLLRDDPEAAAAA